MRVDMSVDVEEVAGIVDWDQVRGDSAAHYTMRRAKSRKPDVVTLPVTMETQWATSLHADMVAMLSMTERTGDRSIRWISSDVPSAYKTYIAAYLIARNADR